MTPQHLQQSDRYHEALVHARVNAVVPYDWGVLEVQFDDRALTSGQVRVTKAKGVFPDGSPFFVGEGGEDQVEARPLEGAFPAALDALDVFLALPNFRETAPNVALDPAKVGPAVRWVASQATSPDINTGRNDTVITWSRINMRLLFGTEGRDAYEAVRIAQLVRDRTGAIVLKPTFIPSILRIGASDFVMNGMRRVLSAAVGKQKSLAENRRMRTAASVDFQASDTAKFWMLHTMNSFIPMFSHLVDHGDCHPEQAYLAIGSLIGEMCTFASDADPTAIPKFNYMELGESLLPMCELAVRLISEVMAESYTVVPLEKRDDGMYLGKFEDPKLPRTHELFLEAKGPDEAILRERLPKLMKVGSWTQIGYILNAAMPGVEVGIEYRPPGAIPIKPGLVYLRVGQSGNYWNDILGSGTIAIYQPIDPQKVDLRLIAVKASK